MDTYINQIAEHPSYRKYYDKICYHEHERIYCKHDMVHFLDVARIGYILNLEEELHLSKSIIYASALLHDIGRFEQYEHNTPHEEASANLSLPILKDLGYNTNTIHHISLAIKNHRNPMVASEKTLQGILYRSDKLSRPCHSCTVNHLCHRTDEKKNMTILY